MEPSTRDLRADRYHVQYDSRYVTVDNSNFSFKAEASYDELVRHMNSTDGADCVTEELEVLDFTSDGSKILFKVDAPFYHFFIDSLPLILKLHKEHPDKLLILYIEMSQVNKSLDDLTDLLISILNREGVNYTAVTCSRDKRYAPICKINNYSVADPYFSGNHVTSLIDVAYSSKLVLKYAREVLGVAEMSEPDHKVYLTRGKNAGADIGRMEKGYTSYKDDIRMNDPEKLEGFFSALGYEVVNPEKDFESILHQIVYMSEVKSLVSVTSSGLANMVFMKPGQTIIELQAEIVQTIRSNDGDVSQVMQGVHTMYQILTFMQQHVLISIPSNRDPNKVIETLSQPRFSSLL